MNCVTNRHNQRLRYIQEHTCYILDPHLNLFQDQVNRFLIDTKIGFPLDRGSEGLVLATHGDNTVYWKTCDVKDVKVNGVSVVEDNVAYIDMLIQEAIAPIWSGDHTTPYSIGDYVIHNNRLYKRKNNEDPSNLEQEWVDDNWEEIAVADEFYNIYNNIEDVNNNSISRDAQINSRITTEVETIGQRLDNIDSNINVINEHIDSIDSDIDEINAHINEVNNNSVSRDNQINARITTEVQTINLRLDGVDSSINTINVHIDSIDNDIDEINERIEHIDDNTYTKTEVDNKLDLKVDKVAGKGLSTNDYTNTDKTKLSGIAAGAEVNVQSDWTETNASSDSYIKNKPTIPTALSQLLDDSTHRLVSDSDKSNWNSKVSSSDLANYQPKLTSANQGTNVTITEVGGIVKISATGGSGGTTVIANPTGSGTATLNKLQVEETIYNIPSGGGSGTHETWTFLDKDGDTITKEVMIWT